VDLLQAQQRKKFIYIDAFSQLFVPVPGSQSSGQMLSLDSHPPWGTQLAQTIVNATKHISVEKPALFIDGLDFLLAAGGDEITVDEILTLVSSLSEVCPRLPTETKLYSVSPEHSFPSLQTTISSALPILLLSLKTSQFF
jgi:hypothetical protein